MAILGVNAWAVTVLVPLLVAGARGPMTYLLAAVCVIPLGVGLALFPSRRAVASWLLLGLYPTALASTVAAAPALSIRQVYSAMGLVLATASLLAYGAGAARSVSLPEQLRSTTSKPLEPAASPTGRAAYRAWLQRSLLWVTTIGALAIAVVAPTLDEPSSLEQAWGQAAREAAALSAIAAAVLGSAIVALVVAPATRRSRRRAPSPAQTYVRVTLLLVAVAAGVLTMRVAGFW